MSPRKTGIVDGSVRKKGGIKPLVQLQEDVYTLAKQRMTRIFDEFDHVLVSFSGGKDSTAVLNVALEVAHSEPRFARHLPLRVVFYDEEAIAPQTEEYVRRVGQRPDVALEWYCLPVKHRNAASRRSPYWYPWAPEDKAKWCRPLPPEALTSLPGFPNEPDERLSIPHSNGLLAPPSRGNTAIVMGIRAQESMTRARAVRRKAVDNFIIPIKDAPTAQGNVWKAYPVYDWKTEDVWTAPRMFGWDYNHCYDHMEMMGIPHHSQRCSPPFGEEPLGGLHMWAECFPEVWDKMVERVPGVGAALRYARTELWAYGGVPEKPVGQTWVSFLTKYITQFPEKDQHLIAKRIQDVISIHYRKTTMPILVKNRHPDSGVSWNYLLKLAMRGDFKQRNPPTFAMKLDSEGRTEPKYWHRYVGELEQAREDGTLGELSFTGRLPMDLMSLIPPYAKEYTEK